MRFGRNHRVREERPAGAVRVAGGRIVDPEGRVQRQHLAEIAVPHPRGRHGVGVEAAVALVVPLPRAEDRTAGSAESDRRRCRRDRDARIELGRVEIPAAGVQLVLLAEEERRALEVVGARLGLDRRRRATGHALRRVEAVGRDVDVLDRLDRGDVADVMRQPHVDAGGAVDARDVVVAVGAVDVGRQRAARACRSARSGRSAAWRRAPGSAASDSCGTGSAAG